MPKQIISASRRTDIPAFYAEKFIADFRRGFTEVENSYNHQLYIVSLKPEDVSCIVFWTKNAAPLLPFLDEIQDSGTPFYFQYTINRYHHLFARPDVEPNVPHVLETAKTICKIVDKYGKKSVVWRYDPIILSNKWDAEHHLLCFDDVITVLDGNFSRVVTSLFDDYNHSLSRLGSLLHKYDITLSSPQEISQQLPILLEGMVKKAKQHNSEVFSCAEEWQQYGVKQGSCIDADYIQKSFGIEVNDKKDRGQRPLCGCATSKDIGQYNTCKHGCTYCYATI